MKNAKIIYTMETFSSNVIIHVRFLPHEKVKFTKLYSILKNFLEKDEKLSKLSLTKNSTPSGVIIKIFSADQDFIDSFINHKITVKFLNILKTYFTLQPQTIFHKGK